MEHDYKVHTNCQRLHCSICDGGLSVCNRCGLTEGCLTTDCPGTDVYLTHADRVYAGDLDFVGGQWVETSNGKVRL